MMERGFDAVRRRFGYEEGDRLVQALLKRDDWKVLAHDPKLALAEAGLLNRRTDEDAQALARVEQDYYDRWGIQRPRTQLELDRDARERSRAWAHSQGVRHPESQNCRECDEARRREQVAASKEDVGL